MHAHVSHADVYVSPTRYDHVTRVVMLSASFVCPDVQPECTKWRDVIAYSRVERLPCACSPHALPFFRACPPRAIEVRARAAVT